MSNERDQPLVTVDTPTPVILDGRPHAPRWLGAVNMQSRAAVGPNHIHAATQPDPSDGGGPSSGGGAKGWTARWSVRSLPDPHNGMYWLGDASSADGTAGITSAARQWKADNDSGPAWHSFFPYKPSVVAVNHYLEGGAVIHHPKGVNFNSHYIEHMWMDWGGAHRQPFTWLIAATATAWPPGEPWHHLLNSGTTSPRLGINQLGGFHPAPNDPDGYRTQLAITRDSVVMRTAPSGSGGIVRVPTNAALHPRLYIGIFNGSQSYVGVYGPRAKRLRRGKVSNGHDFTHRHYVLGRAHNHLTQQSAGSLLVFEMRYFNRALDSSDLLEQYRQIAGNYHFHRYLGS